MNDYYFAKGCCLSCAKQIWGCLCFECKCRKCKHYLKLGENKGVCRKK